MPKILITGANGWVGSALGRLLVGREQTVWGLTRRAASTPEGVTEWVHEAPDFAGLGACWPQERSFDVLFHLAARVHAGRGAEPSREVCFASNATATLELARLARDRGVRRFVFVSSAKALGEADPGRPWREDDEPHPQDAYGQSKRAAELALHDLTGIETVIVRPPLVYGPGVRANFARLLHAVQKGWPLPLGCATAERSLIALDNLTDALALCATHPEASGRLFHVADREDRSVVGLVTRMGAMFGRPARLVPVPIPWLRATARLVGREAEIGRLTDALRLDTRLIQEFLHWRAPWPADDSLRRTVEWYQTRC